MQHLVLYRVCSYCNIHELIEFTWAGACIPVASVSPINVFPIQCVYVLKHCGAHKHAV